MQKSKNYSYQVIWSEEDQQHVGLCAEFPSLSWLFVEPAKALEGIMALVEDVIAEMSSSGDPIPEPL